MPAAGRRGFTLVEAVVSLTLTMVLVGLVSTIFVAQTDFYGDVVRRSQVHDVTWNVGNLVANDIRAVNPEGILVAQADQLVAHVPLSLGVACEVSGNNSWGYYPRGGAGLNTDALTGFSVRDENGTWHYDDATWASMYSDMGATGKQECADVGMDTLGIPDSLFLEISGAGNNLATPPYVGGGIALHRELDLTVATSVLDSDHLALYRGTYGGTLVEFATGLGEDTEFSYRLAEETAFQSSVTGTDMASIEEVRVTVHGISGDQGGGLESYEHTLTRDITLANHE